MGCCAGERPIANPSGSATGPADEVRLASRRLDEGLWQTEISVPAAHCGGCISAVEGALAKLDGVVSARLNLSTRRATVKWTANGDAPPFVESLARAGFDASLYVPSESDADPEGRRLLRATAVAGFAAMNIMLLSVSVWAGADEPTRAAFHWISAVLALGAVAYSGGVFFRSAWSAIASGRTNMDVPISIGILLALGLSLYDTFRQGPHAYFDAVTTLIFFLLAGRTLDHAMRRRARTAVLGLARMMPRGATVLSPDRARTYKPLEDVGPGERVLVSPGERVPFDGIVEAGEADVDAALVTGEATPLKANPGERLASGMLNLNGSLELRVVRPAAGSFIAEMIGMMEAAEQGRANYRRLADRAARLYSPVVHSLAALAFAGWLWSTGDWHRSLTVAISVLIITCPCALGLAVPMVQVVAARRLFERGIALKDGSGLERLAEADTAVLDKTGTVTLGQLRVARHTLAERDRAAAAALAARSRHPVARAVAALAPDTGSLEVRDFAEHAGWGIEASVDGARYRLGRADWAPDEGARGLAGTVLARDGVAVGEVELADELRPGAGEAVARLREQGFAIEMLSGDRRENVAAMAEQLGLARFAAGLTPGEKIARLQRLEADGRKTLMIGDGLNDGPALAAAHVSMAPADAADIGRAAADLVFLGSDLGAVPVAVGIARAARRRVFQNLALAIVYNVAVIPLAVAGLVTPLMAAVAMSLSSIAVVANSLRFPRAPERNAGLGSRQSDGPELRRAPA